MYMQGEKPQQDARGVIYTVGLAVLGDAFSIGNTFIR